MAEGNGPSADNFTGYSATNSDLTIVGNVSRNAAGNNGIHFGGTNITISNNIVDTSTDAGILVSIDASNNSTNAVVSGNVVTGASGSNGAIWMDNVEDFVVTGNVVGGSASHGIQLNAQCHNGVVSANTCKNNTGDGIRADGTCSQISISGNSCIGNTSNGIRVDDLTESSITGNCCKDNAAGFAETGASNTNIIVGNDFIGNTSDTPTVTGAATQWRENAAVGTNTEASAATLTLPAYTDYVYVTGTTTITSITASWARRVVTLRLGGSITVTDGSNLILAGSFAGGFNDTITLVSDGSNWYEISRSNN